jgi:hypothetical protein
MIINIGDIFWLQIEYEDIPNESKVRPVIVIEFDKEKKKLSFLTPFVS